MSTSKMEFAYSFIKNKIITGELAPLANISEDALQAELQFSRTPIREALLQLQAENFLEIYPRKGVIVAPLTFELFHEIYEVRRVVEPYLFRCATEKLPENWLLRIRERFLHSPVSPEDTQQFNAYQEKVLAELSPFLEGEELCWLQDICGPL